MPYFKGEPSGPILLILRIFHTSHLFSHFLSWVNQLRPSICRFPNCGIAPETCSSLGFDWSFRHSSWQYSATTPAALFFFGISWLIHPNYLNSSASSATTFSVFLLSPVGRPLSVSISYSRQLHSTISTHSFVFGALSWAIQSASTILS